MKILCMPMGPNIREFLSEDFDTRTYQEWRKDADLMAAGCRFHNQEAVSVLDFYPEPADALQEENPAAAVVVRVTEAIKAGDIEGVIMQSPALEHPEAYAIRSYCLCNDIPYCFANHYMPEHAVESVMRQAERKQILERKRKREAALAESMLHGGKASASD